MGQYTSYYLYQKYEQRGEQEAIPVYPNVYSIDADGTMERVVKIQDDPQCGYDPPVKPIYKWVNIPITQDYVCDDCPTYQTRWVKTDETICSGTPTPVSKKLVATYTGGITNEVDCNDSTTLTSGETQPSGYVASAMTSAVIGNCVTSIGYKAFSNCSGLTSIDIPDSVTDISYYAFDYCVGLQSIDIPTGVTSISYGTFRNCGLTSVSIPNSVTSISDDALRQCHSLTSVTIGSGVTTIGVCSFYICTSLRSINIPNSVTSIGGWAFAECSSLTSVTIGSGVTSISEHAFYYCSGLTSVTCLGTTPPRLGYDAFYSTNNCPIYVPTSSVNAYKTATNWSTYASRIQPIT